MTMINFENIPGPCDWSYAGKSELGEVHNTSDDLFLGLKHDASQFLRDREMLNSAELYLFLN